MELYKSKIAWILGGFEYLHADDLVANPGSGGATFRTDQLGTGQHVPYTKLMDGTADGTAVIPGDATNGLFVQVKASALPSGAATAAKQPALGTAGSSSTDVLSVQGIASGTALPISAASLPLPSGAATETTLAALNTKTATAKTSDYDSGAGTDIVPMMGIALPASGGAVQGGTATNPVRVDPTGTTAQPVTDNSGSLTMDSAQLPAALGQTTMAASLSVALASNQSALPITDNAGSLTVDNGGTFAVQADGSVASGAADSGNPVKVGGKYNSTPPTFTDGQRADLQTDANGFLKVNVAAGGGSGGTALADKAAFTEGTTSFTPVGGVYNETITADPTEDQAAAIRITAKRALHVNLRDSSGNELAAGNQYAEDAAHTSGDLGTVALVRRSDSAASSSGTDGDYSTMNTDASGRLWVNASGVAVPVTDNSGSLTVDNGGTFAVQAAQSGTWTVQPGNTANTTPWLTTQTPATSGGLAISRTLAAASTNATSVKASAGQVFGWYIYNASASALFLKLYNTSSAPTAGSGTPVMTIPIPPASAANCEFANGIAFATGIGFTMTGAVADNDTTALSANDLVLNLLYK